MTTIVQTTTRWVQAFIFLFGWNIVLFGHLTPGGGFAGGVIVACAFVLITLAYGGEVVLQRLGKTAAGSLDSFGALLFLLIAWLGVMWGGSFFVNYLHRNFPGHDFRLFSAGIIPLCNVAIAFKVGASLFLVFLILASTRSVVSKQDDSSAAWNGKDPEDA